LLHEKDLQSRMEDAEFDCTTDNRLLPLNGSVPNIENLSQKEHNRVRASYAGFVRKFKSL